MINEHLTNQNKCLYAISIFLFIISAAFLYIELMHGHKAFAVIQFSMVLVAIASIIKLITANVSYIKKFETINQIEITSYPIEDETGVEVMRTKVGNLDFKFTKDD